MALAAEASLADEPAVDPVEPEPAGEPEPVEPEPAGAPAGEPPELDLEAVRLVGELHRASIENDSAAEVEALQALLRLPAGPGDAELSAFVCPVLHHGPRDGAAAPRDGARRLPASAVAAYDQALRRWGDAGGGLGRGWGGGAGPGGGGRGGVFAGGGGGRDVGGAAGADETGGGGGGGGGGGDDGGAGGPGGSGGGARGAGGGGGAGGAGGGDGASGAGGGAGGSGAFVPLAAGALDEYCACERPIGPEDAVEFSRYLPPGGDPSDMQQRLGRAGEALAAAWLRDAVATRQLDDVLGGDDRWLVIWRNMGVERGEPWDILLKGARGELFVEVKTTSVDDARKPVEVSLNHLDFARAHPDAYFLLRVYAVQTADGAYAARSVALYGRVAEAIETKAIQLLLRM